MNRSVIIVQSNPVDGREPEYEDWYVNQHVHDVVAVPGYVRAQLFRKSVAQREGVPSPQFAYVAIYELDVSPAQAIENLNIARDAGMYVSPAMKSERLLHAFDLLAAADRQST